MSTATAPKHQQQTANAAHKDAAAPLEQVIEQTNKQQSVIRDAADILGVPWQKLCDLLRNVWKTSKGQPPLTDQEMFSGISMIARFELDPIAKEVYVSRDNKGRLMTIIGIDGFVKILDRTDHYDGHDVEIHELADGTVDWIETCIHSKKRSHPTIYRAYAKEYAALGGFMAVKIPIHMLRLFSLHHAARLFTPIGGNVLTKEEAEFIGRNDPEQQSKAPGLDELTNMLKPIEPVTVSEDLPESSYQPKAGQESDAIQDQSPDDDGPPQDPWEQFVHCVKECKHPADINGVSDHWLPKFKGTPREAESVALVRERETKIREGKGKQKTFVDPTQTA